MPSFEHEELLQEYGRLHPEARLLIASFDRFLLEELEQPACHITCIHRTPGDQRRIYTPKGLELLERIREGGAGLRGSNLREAQALEQLVDNRPKGRSELEVVGQWAEARPSWHPRWTAVDVRNKSYPLAIREKAAGWLEKRCADVGGRRPWELITEDHGTGPHWHIARRDFAWLKRLESPA